MSISIANVALSDTFDIWRVRTNQALFGLNRATDLPSANTIVFRDDGGNTSVVSLDSEYVTSNSIIANNLVVSNTIDFSTAEISNTGVINYTDIRSGLIQNVVITGLSSDIDIPSAEFDTLRVTSTINFSGSTVTDLGTVENLTIESGTLGGVTINREFGGIYSTADLKTLIVRQDGVSLGEVNFQTANVLHLGYVSTGHIAGGQIENVDLNLANSSGSFYINVFAYFQNNAQLRASSATTGSSDYFYIKTTGSTTGSTLKLVDEGSSTQSRSVLRVSQNNSSATGSTALSVHAKSGKPLVVANNSADIITVYQNGSVIFAGDTFTQDSKNLIVNDPLIQINQSESNVDSGILIKKDTTNAYAFFWDSSASKFSLGETSSSATTSGNITVDATKYLDLKLRNLEATGTTDSTSTTTGSVRISGGVGIAKKLYVGDDVVISSGGILDVNDTSEASSTTTGSVRISGGVGIAKKLYVGGAAYLTGGLDITGNIFADRVYPCHADNAAIYFDYPTGNYGSIQINGSGKGNWEGYSIDGNVLFMHDGATTWGIYDDVNNKWLVYGQLDADESYAELRFNGSSRIKATSDGCSITGTITESSAISLKENITPITDSLSIISKLNGVKYDWKDKKTFNDKRQIGLIAENVKEVIPEAEINGTVAYTKLVGLLVEGIKDLSNKVKELEEKIKG